MSIDEITARFYSAFTNAGGSLRDIDVLYDVFHPQALIVKNVGGVGEVMNVREFVEPRRAILSDGTLTDFVEEEVAHKMDAFGTIAHRFSTYRKKWKSGGDSYSGGGAKSLQFIQTPSGWKIISLVWDDES